MTAATIRSANKIIKDLQLQDMNIVSLTEIGSEGSVLKVYPPVDRSRQMTLFELHKASKRYYIARNGNIRNDDGTRYE